MGEIKENEKHSNLNNNLENGINFIAVKIEDYEISQQILKEKLKISKEMCKRLW